MIGKVQNINFVLVNIQHENVRMFIWKYVTL